MDLRFRWGNDGNGRYVAWGVVIVSAVVVFQVRGQDPLSFVYPAIAEFGRVVRLPEAAHQPRDGSRIVVDATRGGPPDAVNPAIEKVARFVNIYAGAGRHPASAEIVVVLHGDATLGGLKHSDYRTHCGVSSNPNLALIRDLHNAGVEFYVCGQALSGKGVRPSEVDASVHVAVSALTTLVNLQHDGFAYIPLH